MKLTSYPAKDVAVIRFQIGIKIHKNSFLKYRNPKNSPELALEILEKTGVALTPGVDFGQGGEGFLRFSYANSAENLGIAVDRLAESGLL